MSQAVRVVVADDSPFVCRVLTSYLQSSSDVRVVGEASDGARAVELVKKLRPDAVTLDVDMPGKGGLEALSDIMHDCPTPAIMVSGVGREAAEVTLKALEMGAVDFILKYVPGVDMDPEALRKEIVSKVKAAARIKVVRSLRRRPGARKAASARPGKAAATAPPSAEAPGRRGRPSAVVVIGASTGGPMALRDLLRELPADLDAAVLIVQHMPATFTGVLAAQLDRQVAPQVKEAEHGEPLRRGVALVAPGDHHLLVGRGGRVELNRGPKIGGHRPSVDVTMQSAAQQYGGRAAAVLLTGMGEDGASGMASVRARGGRTFAQDAASCVVNGMPQRAVDRGVVDMLAPPAEIGRLLAQTYRTPPLALEANP
jgi:two-component system chemotaxis response regulator CheB